jgi:nitric oxide reductase activation protein
VTGTRRTRPKGRALLAGMYGDSGNECYSASLRLAQQQLARRPERTKVIIYLLDGRPTDEPAETVRQAVTALRQAGTIVIGLFVGHQGQIGLITEIFGAADTIGIEDLRTLPERLGRILLRYACRR